MAGVLMRHLAFVVVVALVSIADADNTDLLSPYPSEDKEEQAPVCAGCTQHRDTPDSTTSPGKKLAWTWELDNTRQHECNIRRVTESELMEEFGPRGLPPLYPHPLVISRNGLNTRTVNDSDNTPTTTSNQAFVEASSLVNITKQFPSNFEVTLSSSNSFSAHRRQMPLTQYLNETMLKETLPNQLSNETWYLFGETYSKEWTTFLHSYRLPKCHTCTRALTALAFGIGGAGSGVQWHVHGPGFSESIHGRKHWILYPPHEEPIYDPDFTSRHWMEYTYPTLAPLVRVVPDGDQGRGSNNLQWQAAHLEEAPSQVKPWECTLHPGEMVYFPDHWHHATINLDIYTAFVSSFTTEHGFDKASSDEILFMEDDEL